MKLNYKVSIWSTHTILKYIIYKIKIAKEESVTGNRKIVLQDNLPATIVK